MRPQSPRDRTDLPPSRPSSSSSGEDRIEAIRTGPVELTGVAAVGSGQRQRATSHAGLSAYRLMLRRSSSIRNAGGRSCWCRSTYSAISCSALRVGSASTFVKKRRHTEMPRLTADASKDKEEASMTLSRCPISTSTPISRSLPQRCDGRHKTVDCAQCASSP